MDTSEARSADPATRRGGLAVRKGRFERIRLTGLLFALGPAFVASVAYVDPGNFATNFQAGAEHGYRLVWIVVAASGIGILLQHATSKLGLVTHRSLPGLSRDVFSRRWNLLLWVQAELVAIATDMAEFVGAAIGLNLVFGMALLPAGLVTAVVALAILSLEQRGYRPFELAILALLALVIAGLIYDFFAVGGESYSGIGAGLQPRLGPGDTPTLAAAILGATVMPHAVYMHSALVADRPSASGAGGSRSLLRFNRIDCVLGLGLAGLVNVSMLCIAATVLHPRNPDSGQALSSVHHQLAHLVGGGAALAFGIALIASGLSSSSVGTYAGQVIMAGFVQWSVPLPVRRLVTMLPSLVVLALATNPTRALLWSQVALSFGVPFALIPLARLTGRSDLMGSAVNRPWTSALLWTAVTLITALNGWLLLHLAFPRL